MRYHFHEFITAKMPGVRDSFYLHFTRKINLTVSVVRPKHFTFLHVGRTIRVLISEHAENAVSFHFKNVSDLYAFKERRESKVHHQNSSRVLSIMA